MDLCRDRRRPTRDEWRFTCAFSSRRNFGNTRVETTPTQQLAVYEAQTSNQIIKTKELSPTGPRYTFLVAHRLTQSASASSATNFTYLTAGYRGGAAMLGPFPAVRLTYTSYLYNGGRSHAAEQPGMGVRSMAGKLRSSDSKLLALCGRGGGMRGARRRDGQQRAFTFTRECIASPRDAQNPRGPAGYGSTSSHGANPVWSGPGTT